VHVHRIDLRQRPKVGRWIAVFVGIVVLAGVVPTLIGLYAAWRATRAALSPTLSRLASETAPVTPQQLKALPAGYHALQAAAPAGGYGALDPTAALSWALAIAQAWEADARLERIDVARLRPEGTVNVADDRQSSVTYRFQSPARQQALREQARLSSSAQSATGLWVRVKSGRPDVYVDVRSAAGVDGAVAPHPRAMHVASLLGVAAVRHALDGAPFVDGYMIHIEDEGWVWYFRTLDGQSLPRVRASDGAVWPYQRRAGI
jgi:hypothetical protein